jgi:glycerophosphoryl diester phosphodiesterase
MNRGLMMAALVGALLGTGAATPADAAQFATKDGGKPLVIGHRGAAGYLPDHTLEGYRTAIAMGADFIEPDLVSTKDGVLIARHEPVLTDTTNVKSIAKFANRKRKGVVDSIEYDGWFASDFTLAEIKELRAVQPRAPRSTKFDGAFEIPTFQEVIDLAKKESARTGRTIGIYPETKHPTWHRQNGLPLEETLVAMLSAAGYSTKAAPVIVQSFEIGNLKKLRTMTGVRLVQLLSAYDNDINTGRPIYLPKDPDSAPWDWIAAGDTRNYGDMLTPSGLAEIATYADGIGPWKRQFVGVKGLDTNGDGKADDVNGDGSVNEADGATEVFSTVIADAHKAGLVVHPYTFRDDVPMARDYVKDPAMEYRLFYALGVDGLFTDFSDTAYTARETMAAGVLPAIEAVLAGSNAYFRSTNPTEFAVVASGRVGSWSTTTDRFNVWSNATDNAAAVPVCRIYVANGARHFYSLAASECAAWKAQAGAVDEGVAFYAVAPSAGGCPTGTTAVDRLRISADGIDYERHVASANESAAMVAKGWTRVGIGFCGAKP